MEHKDKNYVSYSGLPAGWHDRIFGKERGKERGMALETLRGIKKIGGFDVAELDDFVDKRPNEYIVVNHKNNGISFKIQNGPIKEVGINGCQIDTLLYASLEILMRLEKKHSHRSNSFAIRNLECAIEHLYQRTLERESRGVEGYDKK